MVVWGGGEAWFGGVSPWHGGLLSGVFGGDGGGELGGLGLYALWWHGGLLSGVLADGGEGGGELGRLGLYALS